MEKVKGGYSSLAYQTVMSSSQVSKEKQKFDILKLVFLKNLTFYKNSERYFYINFIAMYYQISKY